jgi:hypothetical protein
MRRLLPGLGQFFAIVGAYFFMHHLVELDDFKTDQGALPYLEAASYYPPEGCPSAWDGRGDLPLACTPRRYRILSATVRRKFNLPQRKRSDDGWWRIGKDAFDLTCNGRDCRSFGVAHNVFVH